MSSPVRVLVVDEDADVLELTRTFLEREDGLSVATERSARAALDRIAAEQFDAVISDYRMPAMDGVELAAAVADRRPDLPYLLFTARAEDDFERDLSETPVTEHVRKDVGTEQYAALARTIKDAVGAD